MEGFSISKGNRGEFLVLLLLILARDAIVGSPDELADRSKESVGSAWLTSYMASFFRSRTVGSRLVHAKSKCTTHASEGFPKRSASFQPFREGSRVPSN
jgi:hypothetical protein